MTDAGIPSQELSGLPGLIISVLFSAAIFYVFHDVYWYAPDEGAYAHVAERILNGEVLSRDVKDIHAGYGNFVNAFAMAVFGETLVSMRYPLVLMGLIEAGLIYLLVASNGRAVGVVASMVFTAVSTVQYLNPTANWYVLFITVLLIFLLDRNRENANSKLEQVGFLLVTIFLFRQLSGVIVALGVVSWLILRADDRGSDKAILGRGVLSVMALGLAVYLWSKTEIVGFLLFGIWPLGILIILTVHVRISDLAMWRVIWRMSVGGLLALVPLVAYGLVHGSLVDWFHDTFIAAIGVARFDFGWYAWVFGVIAVNLGKFSSLHELANAFYWLVMTLISCAIGGLVWFRLIQGKGLRVNFPPLLFIPPFYGLVAITHLQIPIYLMYPAGLTLAGLLYVVHGQRARYGAMAGCVFLTFVGLFYQAGQPTSKEGGRNFADVISGNRGTGLVPCPSDRCGLRIQNGEKELYENLLGAIEKHSGSEDDILALPSNPELYFLAERRNPLPFYNSAVGINTEADLARYSATIAQSLPKIVIYNSEDKYNTDLTQELWGSMSSNYNLVEEFGLHRVYQLKP